MKEQMQRRLAQLKSELESGQKAIAELNQKQASLRDTLLQISGGIKILEEQISIIDAQQNSTEAIVDQENNAKATVFM